MQTEKQVMQIRCLSGQLIPKHIRRKMDMSKWISIGDAVPERGMLIRIIDEPSDESYLKIGDDFTEASVSFVYWQPLTDEEIKVYKKLIKERESLFEPKPVIGKTEAEARLQ